MAAELLFIALFLKLNWLICPHSSETYFWIKILKSRPWGFVNKNCTVQKLLFMCVVWKQLFEKNIVS